MLSGSGGMRRLALAKADRPIDRASSTSSSLASSSWRSLSVALTFSRASRKFEAVLRVDWAPPEWAASRARGDPDGYHVEVEVVRPAGCEGLYAEVVSGDRGEELIEWFHGELPFSVG